MIESRCGILCSECGYKEHGHCGQCSEFPCTLLNQFAYDKQQGDDGKRIEQCNRWSKEH